MAGLAGYQIVHPYGFLYGNWHYLVAYSETEQALSTKNYELKTQNDEMKLRISELEGLSDDILRSKLQEWIIEHNGSINIVEFSKLFKVSEARVEEMLNLLVNEGYLEIVQ